MKKGSKAVAITAASLIGVGVAGILIAGFMARQKGWTRSHLVSKTFSIPYVSPEFVDLGEQIENQLTDEELEASFRFTGKTDKYWPS